MGRTCLRRSHPLSLGEVILSTPTCPVSCPSTHVATAITAWRPSWISTAMAIGGRAPPSELSLVRIPSVGPLGETLGGHRLCVGRGTRRARRGSRRLDGPGVQRRLVRDPARPQAATGGIVAGGAETCFVILENLGGHFNERCPCCRVAGHVFRQLRRWKASLLHGMESELT